MVGLKPFNGWKNWVSFWSEWVQHGVQHGIQHLTRVNRWSYCIGYRIEIVCLATPGFLHYDHTVSKLSAKWSIADLLTSSHLQMSASHLLKLQVPQQTPALSLIIIYLLLFCVVTIFLLQILRIRWRFFSRLSHWVNNAWKCLDTKESTDTYLIR